MRALVFDGPGRYGVRDVPRPALKQDDDVLIAIRAVGICGTDLHIVEDPPGFIATPGIILGHELMGEVAAAGERANDLQPGDRVVIEPNIACTACAYCRRGMPNQCLNLGGTGVDRDGGLAEFLVIPARNVHRVPDAMSDDVAMLAEPLSCVLGATEKVKLQPGETAVILGGGPIGLLYLQVFRAAGARRVILVEPQPGRADFARGFGADLVLDPNRDDLAALVREQTEIGADVVVDAVGTQLATSLTLARRGGTILLFGANTTARDTVQQWDVSRNEYRLLGSFVGAYNFPITLAVLSSGAVDTARMITHRIGLDDVPQGIAELRSGRAIKVQVRPG